MHDLVRFYVNCAFECNQVQFGILCKFTGLLFEDMLSLLIATRGKCKKHAFG